MKEEIKNPVELRSERVRNIIGRIPSVLVRYGTLVIGLALSALFAVSAFIPYRETVPVKISVESDGAVSHFNIREHIYSAIIPYLCVGKQSCGQI